MHDSRNILTNYAGDLSMVSSFKFYLISLTVCVQLIHNQSHFLNRNSCGHTAQIKKCHSEQV
jgi:hypothetical protein